MKSKIRSGILIDLSNTLVCQRSDVSSVSFSLFLSRSDNVQESRLGLKSHYAGKKWPVTCSCTERFFLVHLQSPENIFNSTFFHLFTYTEFFLKLDLDFPSLHLHTMEDVVLHLVSSHRYHLSLCV